MAGDLGAATDDFSGMMTGLMRSVTGRGLAAPTGPSGPTGPAGGGLRMHGHSLIGGRLGGEVTKFDVLAQKVAALTHIARAAFVAIMTSHGVIRAREARRLPYWLPLAGVAGLWLALMGGVMPVPAALGGLLDNGGAAEAGVGLEADAAARGVDLTMLAPREGPCRREARACPPPGRPEAAAK